MLDELQSGVCRVCGCTEEDACVFEVTGGVGSCWWIDEKKTLCSNPSCLAVVPLSQIERELQEEANASSVAG